MILQNPIAAQAASTIASIAAQKAGVAQALLDAGTYTPEEITEILDKIDEVSSAVSDFKNHTDLLSGVNGPTTQPNLKTIAETVAAAKGTSATCDFINDAFGALNQGQALLSDAINQISSIQTLIGSGPAVILAKLNSITGGITGRIQKDINAYESAKQEVLQRAFEISINRLVDDPCVGAILKSVIVNP